MKRMIPVCALILSLSVSVPALAATALDTLGAEAGADTAQLKKDLKSFKDRNRADGPQASSDSYDDFVWGFSFGGAIYCYSKRPTLEYGHQPVDEKKCDPAEIRYERARSIGGYDICIAVLPNGQHSRWDAGLSHCE